MDIALTGQTTAVFSHHILFVLDTRQGHPITGGIYPGYPKAQAATGGRMCERRSRAWARAGILALAASASVGLNSALAANASGTWTFLGSGTWSATVGLTNWLNSNSPNANTMFAEFPAALSASANNPLLIGVTAGLSV